VNGWLRLASLGFWRPRILVVRRLLRRCACCWLLPGFVALESRPASGARAVKGRTECCTASASQDRSKKAPSGKAQAQINSRKRSRRPGVVAAPAGTAAGERARQKAEEGEHGSAPAKRQAD